MSHQKSKNQTLVSTLMQITTPGVAACLLAGILGLSCFLTNSAHAAEINLLEQRSGISPKAAGLVQLSIARAGNRLVSVGERGVVLVSDDNGKNWRQSKVPVSVSLTGVAFVNDKSGWAIGHGGVVLATMDAGENWVKQLDGVRAAQLELDAAQAEAQGKTGSADAQRRLTEAQRLVDGGGDHPLLALHFFNPRRGLVVGAYGIAFGTEDGGQTWESLMGSLKAANGRHLYGIQAVGDSVVLVGEQGLVLKSTDGGATFSKLAFPGKGTLFGAITSKANDALLVYGLKGNAFRSADVGRTWEKVEMPPVSLMAGVRLTNGTLLLADESGQLHRSIDAGRHFEPLLVARPTVLADIEEASDGSVIGSGIRGSRPITWMQDNKKDKP
ncbi:WD40/YVTN/BNR-like repeat-containing protein [Janthinobacterium tructae]|uniref:WD40/YVTN/BNR-like repeat-containing protein n=1 Tax=Janthinobacterium tructae TaxID=2590869 RepID=UPI00249A4274|nr:YCF48-related protein [Janthinobacterium tructae]MDI3292324.1 YCF48-related protein [Janthinobacterium tructae]